jgi:anti-sigma B factor antagonist
LKLGRGALYSGPEVLMSAYDHTNSPRTFALSERDLESGQREIHVAGELDLAVAEQLREAIERSESAHTLIDLSDCRFIDSTGIAVLVHAHQSSKSEGRLVIVHSPSDQVLRVFQITGLTANGLVFETRTQAISSSVPTTD